MTLVKNAFIVITALIAVCIIAFFILAQTFHESNNHMQPITINKNSSKSSAKWDEIISQRTKLPIPCNIKSSQNILKITPARNNWLPYFLRCKYIIHDLKENEPIAGELFHSKQLSYIHNYKAGGSTIQIGLNKLNAQQKLNISAPDSYRIQNQNQSIDLVHKAGISKGNFTKFTNSDATIFTFLREPIQKFLSAFFEAIKRKIEHRQKGMRMYDIDFYQMSGIQILRLWIDHMLPLTDNTTHNSNARTDKLEAIPEIKWIDFHSVSNHHIMQPMHSLFTFVGNLENLNNDLPQVLSQFITDTQLKNDASLLMETYFKHQRNRNDGYVTNDILNKFNLKISDLNENDINNLCHIYWSDYICFPFHIPMACNVTDLFVKHYHRHVEYQSCY